MMEPQNQKQSLEILRKVHSKSNFEQQQQQLKQRAASNLSEERGLSANGSQLRLHPRSKSPARIQDSFQDNRNSYQKQQMLVAKANETQGEDLNNRPMVQGLNEQVFKNQPELMLNNYAGVNDLRNQQIIFARQLQLLQQNKDQIIQVTSPASASQLAFSTQLLEGDASFTQKEQHQKTQINTGYGSQQEDPNESGPWTIRQDVMESQMTNNQINRTTEPEPHFRPIEPKQIFCVESSDQEELLQEKLAQQIGNYNHHLHQINNSGTKKFQINQQQWQAQQTTVQPIQQNSHQAISSGAIIFDNDNFKYSGDYGATKRLRGSQIISPKNQIKEVRWQQRTAGTALYKNNQNQKNMNDLKNVFSPSNQNNTQNSFKNGKDKQNKRSSLQQLTQQESQTSGPPRFKSHQRALTAHIALQRSHQKIKALALKQKQTSLNQKQMTQQSASKLGPASLIKERNNSSQKSHSKSSKLLLMSKNKEMLQQKQLMLLQQQEQLLQQQMQQHIDYNDAQNNFEYAGRQDGVVVVHSTRTAVGSRFQTSQDGNSQLDNYSEVRAQEEPKKMVFREQITVTSKSREREGGETTTNAELAIILARDAKVVSDGQQSFSKVINSQNSGSPKDSEAIVVNRIANVIDLNQMAQDQLPVRSTSQMENMVNLGGSYDGIPNDIDLQNQKNEQLNQLNQVIQQKMNDSGGQLSENNGQLIDLQTNLNRLDSSPLVNLSSGGIDNDDLLPAQYQAVNSGAFNLATNSDQLLMQHLSKIKQETSLKRLISARQQPTNSMTSFSQNRHRQRKNTAHHLSGNASISKQGYSIVVQQPSSINDVNNATNRHNSFLFQQLQQKQPQLQTALDSQSMNHHYNQRQRSLQTASVVILNNHQNMNANNQSQIIQQQQPLNHSQTANHQILMENIGNDGSLQTQQDQNILGRNRYKGRLMSFQGVNNNNNHLGAFRQSVSQVNSPSMANSNFDQKNHSVGQYTFQGLEENEQGGRVVYQVSGDKNNMGSEKVIVRVKQSARDRNNYSRKSVKSAMTRKSGQQASYQLMRDRNPNLQNNNLNRRCIDMKVGSLSTQSNCTFRDMVYVSQDNQTLNELTKNFKQDLGHSRQQRMNNNFLQTQDIPTTQQVLQSPVQSSNLGSSQILVQQAPQQEEEKETFSKIFKQQKAGGRNFDRKKSLTQRQIRIQQQYERRQTLNLQNNMQRKYSHQQKLVQKQHDIQLEKQQRLRYAIELSNSQVLDYANIMADQSKKITLDVQIHDSQTNLTNSSPLKVITEDNGSSINMAPQNLYARKSSAIPCGTQNLSEAFQQSLVTNNISELADQTHKILVIKPPDVEFKMKTKPSLVDIDKVDLTRHRSSEHQSKQKSEQERQIGRIQSMKGINWGLGMNQSIDINTDKLRLSTTGKDANIISYRKLSKQIQLNSSEQALNLNRRTPSAKVTSNPRKLINTRQDIDVDLNSRVIESPDEIIQASPNTIYKSDQYGSNFKSNLFHSKSPAVAKEILDYPQMINSNQLNKDTQKKPFDSRNNNLPYMPGLSPRRSLKSTKPKFNNVQQISGGMGQLQPVSSFKPNQTGGQKAQQSFDYPREEISPLSKNSNTKQMRSSEAELIVFRASGLSLAPPITDQMLKQNESALTPATIHNFLDSKYQEEQNRLMAQNDGSTDGSKTNSNQIRPQQSSTILKNKNSMTNILPQELPTTFVLKQMPINHYPKKQVPSAKHSIEQSQQEQIADVILDPHMPQQNFDVGSTKAILIRKPNSTNNVNKDSSSSHVFPSSGGIIKKSNKILANKDCQGSNSGATAKHAQAMAISNNSSIIAAHSPTFKKVKSERAHYNQQTTEELQPAITPLSLVEVSVKRHTKRDQGFSSRQNSKPLSSNRNNINSKSSKRKFLSNGKVLSSANSRTGSNLQHVYLRDRYDVGQRDMQSNEDDQRDRHHTLVESSIVGGIQGFQISPSQKVQNK